MSDMNLLRCIDHNQKGNKDGYSRCRYKGKVKLIHRVRYAEHHNLPLENLTGQVVLHICDNPRCINVDHLKLGTVTDNVRDRVLKHRFCGSTAHAAKLTDEYVNYIREHYTAYCKINGATALARRFNVVPSVISAVAHKRRYKETSCQT